MKPTTRVLLLFSTSSAPFFATPVHAAELTVETSPSNWSLGVGVEPTRLGAIGAVGGLGGLASLAPTYGVSLERRLVERLWLRMDAGLGYTRFGGVDDSLYTRATVGLRYTVIDARGVMLSPYLDVGGGYNAWNLTVADADGVTTQVSESRWNGEASLGLAAEYCAMHAFDVPLALRFGLDVLSAGFSSGTRADDTSTWFARLDLVPRLEIRLYF